MEYLVDILMPVYNHENYIEAALKGVVSQKTDFKFRLLIGEDSSKDNTRSIIERYHKDYPDILVPFYREKNLGAYENGKLLFSEMRSKYVALCEGDDYWTDPLKLQKQVDVLEKDSKLSMAAHGSYRLTDKLSVVDSPFNVDTIWSTKDILVNNWFIMTASLMFRRSMMDLSPDWFSKVSHADLALILLTSLNGNGFYTPEPMCVYRIAGLGIMSRFAIKESKGFIFLLDQFNKKSDYKFDKEITALQNKIRIDIVHQYIAQNKSIPLFSLRYWQNVIQCLKWARIENYPNLAKKLIRGKLSK